MSSLRRSPRKIIFAGSLLVLACACSSQTGDGTAGGGDAGRAGGVTNLGGAASGTPSGGAGGTSEQGIGGSAGVPGGAGGFAGAASVDGGAGGSNTGAFGGSAGTGGSPGLAGSGGASGDGGAGQSNGGAGQSNGGAGRSNGGAGGQSAYNPCPTNGSPCKILPFGDSITRGVKSSDDAGYRSQLFKLIAAAKQKVTFTGSLTNGPAQVSGQAFPRMHEGHPGWTIDPGYNTSGNYGGISSLVPAPALSGDPDIILLHIGTNDLFARDTANMSTRLEALIDKIAQNAPSALIVLAEITPRNSASAALTTYNSKIPGIVQSHAAKGQHIVGVDMSRLPVPADLSSDGTHPNDQGYAYMASIWYAGIKDLLPK